MVEPLIQTQKAKFGWNLTANVGLRSPNKSDDVALVKLCYYCLSQNPASSFPSLKGAAAALNLESGCDGTDRDPLVSLIREHQRLWGGTQDGHISRLPATNFYSPNDFYSVGAGSQGFLLAVLLNNLYDITKAVWPRIDRFGKCPSSLKRVPPSVFDR